MHDLTATLSHSDHNLFRSDVVDGLPRLQKTIPCRWLYDGRGSDLFEEITRLEEYYPTRAETAILRARQPELRQFAGPGPILIEYGVGAGVKTELVLDALAAPQGYVPVDVAHEYLLQTAHRMERRFRPLWVRPVPQLPERIRDAHGHARCRSTCSSRRCPARSGPRDPRRR
jgi:uncharacterized SAM-dependent methyltransferase